MKPIYPITFILSSNDINGLEQDLNGYGIPTKRVLGRFNGLVETSIVAVTDAEYTVNTLAKKHGQLCILKLDPTRHATLVNCLTGETKDLGQLVGSKCEPEGDYTFDGSTYFTTE